MSTFSKIVTAWGVALVVGGIVVLGSQRSQSNTPVAAQASRPAPAQSMPPKEVRTVFRIDVGVLADEYDSNEIATDLKLKGNIIEVSGTVNTITKDAFGYLRVGLVTRNQFLSASMKMDKKQEATLGNLQKGQPVIIRCEKMQRWGGAPYGDNCILM
jgi:hypothetical protein